MPIRTYSNEPYKRLHRSLPGIESYDLYWHVDGKTISRPSPRFWDPGSAQTRTRVIPLPEHNSSSETTLVNRSPRQISWVFPASDFDVQLTDDYTPVIFMTFGDGNRGDALCIC